MKKAILLISHGSYSPAAKREVLQLKYRLKKQSGFSIFECAFLEVNHPTIPAGIKRCIKKGATQIIVLLNFLNTGNHVRRDIPHHIKEAKSKFPYVQFRLTPPIGLHTEISHLFLDTIHKYKRF